ncbi:hypothetical protein VPH35_129691 [Triticum aestivum]
MVGFGTFGGSIFLCRRQAFVPLIVPQLRSRSSIVHGINTQIDNANLSHSSKNTRRRWPGSASAPSGTGHGPASKRICASATHAVSFKCHFHRKLPGSRPWPGPGKPPFFASFTSRSQRGAAAPGLAVLVLQHRRDPVTQPKHRPRESRTLDNVEGRKGHIHVIRKGVYLPLPRCIVSFVWRLITIRELR